MRLSIYGLLTLGACIFMTGIYADGDIVDNSTRASFPREVSFEHNKNKYQLQATGVATRKKLIAKVYSVAHYLQKGVNIPNGDIIQAIMSDNNAKQLTMKWVRDVDAEKVRNGFIESFHKVFSDQQYAQMQGEIDNFIQLFNQGAHKGDEFVLRWIPEGYVEVLINNHKVGSHTDPNFAKGLWSIWFGPNSVVNRSELISLMK